MSLTKVCTKCAREFPATVEYFHRQKDCRLGLNARCKECRGAKFGVRFPNRVYKTKEGFKICTGCRQELPMNDEYFVKHSTAKDGYTTKCKVCNGSSYGVHRPNMVLSVPDGHKICSVCRETKEIKEFSKLKDNKDGYMSRCKTCDYAVHKEMYTNNPNTLHKKKAYNKKYRIKYYKTEKGKMVNIINCQRRKSRKQNVIFNYSKEDWKETLEFFNHECAYCGETGKELEQEHVIPLSNNGHYTRQNIIPACSFCNGSKHNHPMEEWYKNQSYFSQTRLKRIYKWTKYDENRDTIQLSFL